MPRPSTILMAAALSAALHALPVMAETSAAYPRLAAAPASEEGGGAPAATQSDAVPDAAGQATDAPRPRVIWRDGARAFRRDWAHDLSGPGLSHRLETARGMLDDSHRFPPASARPPHGAAPAPGWIWREGWIDEAGRYQGRHPDPRAGWRAVPGYGAFERRIGPRCRCGGW